MVYFDGFNILASDLSLMQRSFSVNLMLQEDLERSHGNVVFFHCTKYFQGSFDQQHNMKLLQQAQHYKDYNHPWNYNHIDRNKSETIKSETKYTVQAGQKQDLLQEGRNGTAVTCDINEMSPQI